MEQFNLTFPQKNIYMVDMLNSDTSLNTIAGVLKINKGFNKDICVKIIKELIRSNDALRIKIDIKDNQPLQYVDKYVEPVVDEISMLKKSEEEIERFLDELTMQPIDIHSDKLATLSVIVTGKDTGMIYLKLHHIVGDAWTLMQIVNQLKDMYNKALNNEDITMENPSYLDFIASEKEYIDSEKYKKDEEFWNEYLKDIKEPVTLKDKVSKVSTKATRYSVTLTKEETDSILNYCKENKVSAYTLLLSALATYVYRIKDVDDIVIGTPILNRSNFKEKKMLGCFISTIPMRIKLKENMKFIDLVHDVTTQTMSLFRHQKFPITKTIENIHNTTEIKGKIYNLMLSYQNARSNVNEEENMSTKWIFSQDIQDDLEIHVMDMDNTGLLTINYDYLNELFESIEIEYLHTRLMALVQDAINNNEVSIEDIRIMSTHEENKILYEFNDTDMEYPKDKTVIELFEEQVEKTPDNIALVFEDKQMTYKELNEKANSLAHYLRDEKGVKQGDFIGILVDKSFELIIAIIASLKTGACYVPLEKSHLLERKKYILENSNAKLLIYDEYVEIDIEKVNILNDFGEKVTNLDYKKTENPDIANCVLYTSGTTGEPKGAIIVDRNIIKLVRNADYIEFNSNDKILQAASTSFDVSLFEIWGALLNGGALHVIRKENLITPQFLSEYLNNEKITILWITSALFNQMIEYDATMFKYLRRIFTGGDVISISHVKMLMNACPKLQITNCYGPTECTTFTNTYNIINVPNSKIPIGRTISNTKGYVVDKKMRLLPLMCEGEYVLSGESVALGYINKPELTKEKFVQNIFPNNFVCKRMYKTGDIVQMLNDGNIDFVGRRDNQVKIRGMRIELDEIKNCFMKIPNVKDCVVIIKDTKLGKAIYLYFTANQKLDIENVNKYLKENLLSHMVPVGIMQLDKLPINRNGKVDRKNLPEIKNNISSNVNMTQTQKKLLLILNDMFDITCGIEDNLFELGIDSLAIIRFITKIQQQFNVDIEVGEVFKNPNLVDISKLIENYSNITITTRKPILKILQAQKGIFMQYMMNTENTLYNIPFEISFELSKIDVFKLKSSIEKALENHSILFSTFDIIGGEVIPKYSNENKYIISISNIKENEYEKEKNNFIKPFDLLSGPLFEIEMYKTESKLHVLFNFHHIVFDGVSMLILLDEISKIYSDKQISKEKLNFKEYMDTRVIKDKDIEFFRNMFDEELTINDLPYDRPRGKKIDNKGNKIYIPMSNSISNKIQKYLKNNKFTLNSLMQAAFTILLSKYTYNEDITIGIANSGRNIQDLDNSVGMYVKTMPYRQKINWNDSIKQFIVDTQMKVLDVLSHDSLTYEDILKEVNITRFNNRNPLFDVMFVCQSMNDNNIKIGDCEVVINEIGRDNSKFDITFEIIPRKDNLDITIEYKTSLFNEDTIRGIVKNYINILQFILENPNSNLSDIEMISKEEKELIINKFNDTKTIYPDNKAIHEIFEEIVLKFKDKVAIIFENEKITYDELNKKSNKLARLLIKKGIKKGDTIGVMIDKSSEYMIALLGTLKAGAVYMPISQDMPEERVKYVLNDAKAKVIVTTKKFDREIDDIPKIYINIKDIKSDYSDITDDSNLNLEIDSIDKAYVMYTSGTTGVPKGITIIHRGITRLLLNTNLVNFSENEVMLVSGSVTFDTSGFEIWGAMFYGMTLHFMEKKNILNPSYYEKYLQDNKITTTLIPTPIFNQLTEYNAAMFKNLNTLYVGGDVLVNNYSNEIIEKCHDTKLINIYGPTENTVISTFELVNEKTKYDISIGRPISNTTCYIVDKCEKLCPIKVPGELYTGGDGLGLGYINKPEVTNNKFVYYSETNEKIYKTGDLASFENNGKIKFMGRIDTQIKLRGQRIEILEIKNKILELEAVSECFVMVKENNNNKFLVAYYTCKDEITEKDIIKYLRKYLPAYMIPARIVKLKEMPLNQNSKIDRKRLPEIKFKELKVEKPRNELQRKVLDIYKQVLINDEIGMDSNFFDVGGDSLLAMKLVGIMEENDIHISYSDVFEYSTPLEICNKLQNIENVNECNFGIDISKYDYSNINTIINSYLSKNNDKISGILLTGVTGFLGVHILDSIISNSSQIKVFCLVREKHGISAKERLKNHLKFYFGDKYENNSIIERITIIDGDITSSKIIKDIEIEEVIDNIDIVINSAAHVKHFGEEKIFEEINIKGVNNITDFCIKYNKRLVHISTLSVSGNLLEGGQVSQDHILPNTIYNEKSLYIGQNLNNIYALSKFIAERNILEKVAYQKLQATIIRVGNLTGRFYDGKFQINSNENAFLNRIKTFKNIGLVPENILELDVEFSPVDLVADSIFNIINMSSNNAIYHVYNPNHIKLKNIVRILNKKGLNINLMSQNKMTEIIKDMMKDKIRQSTISGIIQDLNTEKELKYESNIKISCEFTNSQLNKNKFIWPEISEEYILKFFRKTGIIEGEG